MKIAVLAVTTLLLLSGSAEACNRCGIFGRGCRIQSHVAHAEVVQAVAQPTVVITNVYPQPVAAQGTTLYGLSSTFSASLDTQATLNLSARLADSSLELARQANNNVATLAAHDLEVKKILAAGIANAQTVAAANSGPLSIKATISGGSVRVEQLEAVANGQAQSSDDVIQALANKYCVKCHGGASPKANLDLTNMAAFSVKDLHNISQYLVSNDPAVLMPRGADGNGVILPYDDLRAWLCTIDSLREEVGVDPNPVTP